MAKHAKRKIVGWIFRAWVTRKDGTRDWARDHGYKAWRIPIYADQSTVALFKKPGWPLPWVQNERLFYAIYINFFSK